MGNLKIERLGGIAGFGMTNLKSEGEVAMADLPPSDREAVEALFAGGSKPDPKGSADMFRYRITRSTGDKTKTIVVPEGLVPKILIGSVKDSLK